MSTLIMFLFVIGIMGAFVGRGFFRTIRGTVAAICGILLFCFFFTAQIVAVGIIVIILLVIIGLIRFLFSRRR